MPRPGFAATLRILGASDEVRVRVHDGELEVGNESVHLVDISRALFVPARRPHVRIECWSTTFELRVADKKQGHALLRALGFDPSEREVVFEVPSYRDDEMWWLIAVPFAVMFVLMQKMIFGAVGVYVACGMLLPCVVAALIFAWKKTVVTVGRNALSIRRFRERVIPYDVLVEATHVKEVVGRGWTIGVDLELGTEGERLHIPMGRSDLDSPVWESMALAERISAAVDAWDKKTDAPTAPDPEIDPAVMFLARGGRSIGDWLRALRDLEHPSFRSAAIDAERLLSILANARITGEERAAAAVALATNDDPDLRERARIAVRDEPKLRIVLDAAVERDDAALEESLSDLAAK